VGPGRAIEPGDGRLGRPIPIAGRNVRPGVAWVPCPRPGWCWLDEDALAAYANTATGEEHRVLTLAAVLLGADPETRLDIDSGRAVA
jgi:hypothetical protein